MPVRKPRRSGIIRSDDVLTKQFLVDLLQDLKQHLERKIEDARRDAKEQLHSVDKGLSARMGRIEHRMNQLEHGIDQLKGEVRAIGRAVLETGQKVKEHDHDIAGLKTAVTSFSQ